MRGSHSAPAGAFSGQNWSREQVQLACYLYCQTPFGKLHSKNPDIIALASLIGRTPAALAMKCVNIASLDPAIVASGRSGLSKASSTDRAVWNEFHSNWERLALESELMLAELKSDRITVGVAEPQLQRYELTDFSGENKARMVETRIKQSFFRRAVLSSYGNRCCVSGIADPKLLIASHIVPWREDKANRLNPRNGLCLSALHDRAFDAHLFTLDSDFRVQLSSRLRSTNNETIQVAFHKCADRRVTLPDRFLPDALLLAKHRALTLQKELEIDSDVI